jgi:hypothetical protein
LCEVLPSLVVGHHGLSSVNFYILIFFPEIIFQLTGMFIGWSSEKFMVFFVDQTYPTKQEAQNGHCLFFFFSESNGQIGTSHRYLTSNAPVTHLQLWEKTLSTPHDKAIVEHAIKTLC